MSITIHDVAAHAGVSIATVSRVLNGTSPVSEAKRRSVLEAVDTLGYRPNPAARSLLKKRTGGLGVLLPYVSGEFFAELLNGLDRAAQNHAYFLVVSTSHRRPTEFKAAMRAMDRRVDGLVIMAPELDAHDAESILRSETPVAFINTYLDGLTPNGCVVEVLNFENFAGSYALTQHLLETGHRRIALIRGPRGAGDARERARGYRTAMAEAGLLDADALEFEGDYTQAAGYAAASRILETTPRPTAIMAPNGYCAMGVLSALHGAGVDVPGAMAVTGFDGITSARYTVPPLTTVRAPMRDLGLQAIDRLVTILHGAPRAQALRQSELPVSLEIRGSTGG
ncbi:MAG: LacI family DNA-binding transcriptional regulator [Rhodothermales bacterium]|nr:LacI family DNA-binding transcriptional regulator [Rhodothermales bacterium]